MSQAQYYLLRIAFILHSSIGVIGKLSELRFTLAYLYPIHFSDLSLRLVARGDLKIYGFEPYILDMNYYNICTFNISGIFQS